MINFLFIILLCLFGCNDTDDNILGGDVIDSGELPLYCENFIDENENGVYDFGELFIDSNGSGIHECYE